MHIIIVNTLIIEGHFVLNSTLSRMQGTVWMACTIVVLTVKAAFAMQVDVVESIIDITVCAMLPLAIIMIWTYMVTRGGLTNYK